MWRMSVKGHAVSFSLFPDSASHAPLPNIKRISFTSSMVRPIRSKIFFPNARARAVSLGWSFIFICQVYLQPFCFPGRDGNVRVVMHGTGIYSFAVRGALSLLTWVVKGYDACM